DAPAPGTGTAASGPPLTGGEKDALVVAVKACWNVGALSTDALNTIVTVGVSMDQSGMPISNSIRMIGYEGGDEAAARQAYEAGRRAIIRCAKNGYPLPVEKYAQWQEIEIVFNPEKMRMK
ncbi:MAG: energy transducer TonB, partial [Albidovulum sp.]